MEFGEFPGFNPRNLAIAGDNLFIVFWNLDNMHRFFCNPQNISSQQIKILDKNELHHLKDVLRLRNKDKVVVLDGQGTEYICEIVNLGKNCATLGIIEKHIFKKEDFLPRITVACALPKKSKIDFIVEKLTEIGVDKIIILNTERTEVVLKDHSRKIARLKKTAESALKQSGNLFMPQIEFLNFNDLLELSKEERFDISIMPNLSVDTQDLREVLERVIANKILVAIGPEGDFSEKEIKLAKEAGFVSVSLGETVLRVDTAAIVAVSFIKLFLK